MVVVTSRNCETLSQC